MRFAAVRQAWAQRRQATWPLESQLRRWISAVPAPDPSSFARFGPGSWLVPPVHLSATGAARVEVGTGVVVLEQAHLDVGPLGRIVLGDGVRLGPFASLHATGTVVIEAGVSSSDHITVVDGWPPPRAGDEAGAPTVAPPAADVRICAGAYLGANSVIGPGVTVGEGAFVGEGAVVLGDVPAHAVVYGNPAQVVRRLDPTGAWDRPPPVGRP